MFSLFCCMRFDLTKLLFKYQTKISFIVVSRRRRHQGEGDGGERDPEASAQDGPASGAGGARATRAGAAAAHHRPAQRHRRGRGVRPRGRRRARRDGVAEAWPPQAHRPGAVCGGGGLHDHGDRPAADVVPARLGAGPRPGPPVRQQAGTAAPPLPHLLRPALLPGTHVAHAAR